MRTPNNSTEPHVWPINIKLQIFLDSLFTSILVPSCALAFWQSAAAALSRVRSAAAGSRGAERSSAGRRLFHRPGDQASNTRISTSSSWASAACRHREDEAVAAAAAACRPAHLRCTRSLSINLYAAGKTEAEGATRSTDAVHVCSHGATVSSSCLTAVHGANEH
jgi:hypothetical protein